MWKLETKNLKNRIKEIEESIKKSRKVIEAQRLNLEYYFILWKTLLIH